MMRANFGKLKNHIKDSNNNCKKPLLNDHKDKLIQAIKKIKHEIDECYEEGRETYSQAIDVENQFDEMEREIQAEFQNLHRFLEEEEERDLERLRNEKQRRVKALKEREKKIAEQGRSLERAIETLNSKLREDESPKLLNEIKDLLKRCEVTFIPPAAVDSEILSGHFVGPIQYRIWKHMKSSLYPNISMLTLDPETAHPLLSLSPDCTSVHFEEEKEIPVDGEGERNNHQRFNYYYCVIGREGFITGRHYWEVEPTRIGIFLDCDREEVSFYDAVTMRPLFSFSMGTVLVPLFPFYNPCDTDEGKNTGPLSIFWPSL
ncbi:zinc-binding protein A33 isoform X2 [Denticeps clupeoides]|uniref:zinc-binding protein A33 isoform X2 n=1 Tax=Denticeps clupeoides TaxID=299321 RepID=UPI0010A4CB61|nr:zinc-binding protein A33-like isoform X2 [Denticeps clupeoides]